MNYENLETIPKLWEVEVNDNNIQKFDSRYLNGPIGLPSTTTPNRPITYSNLSAINNAHKYWNQEISSSPRFEILVKPPIRVIRTIDY